MIIRLIILESVIQTRCLPCAEMTTLNWKVALTGDVKCPLSMSYAPPMFVTTRSNTTSVGVSTGPRFSDSPTKNAILRGV